MNLIERKPNLRRLLYTIFATVALGSWSSAIGLAQAPQYGAPANYPPANDGPLVDTRAGGVLQESYDYQRGGQQPGLISPATGWYHYGFPVSTYRWGWFGAEHYYPTVFWHHGYYDDCCRFGYRCGY